MKVARLFDTPLKRVSFIVLIIGAVTLAVSLAVWLQQSRYNRIYYSQDHYQWLPVSQDFAGQTERYWSWDRDCVQPLAETRIAQLKQELEDHRRNRPEQPSRNVSINRDWTEISRQTELIRAYSHWSARESSLKVSVDSANEKLGGVGYESAREGEIDTSPSLIAWGARNPYLRPSILVEQEDTKTDEEKFRDSLYARLGLTGFPAEDRDAIFDDCVRETTQGYKFVRTSYHSDIDEWPDDHPISFWLGMFLTVAGFLGSFGYRMSTVVVQGTAGRLLSWVRTGEGRPSEKPSFDGETSDPVQKASTAVQTEEEIVVGAQAPVTGIGLNRFLPHAVILGGLLAILGLGVVANDAGIARFFGRAAGSAIDPVNLVIAALMGFAIRRHRVLIPSLIALGFALAVLVSQINAFLGARLTPEGIAAKIAAALAVGYLANLILIIFKKEPDQRGLHHDDDEPTSE